MKDGLIYGLVCPGPVMDPGSLRIMPLLPGIDKKQWIGYSISN
jgi:hypothetical protein